MQALPAPPQKLKVLILWARCTSIASALRDDLTFHFQDRCDFELISHGAAGLRVEALSQEHINSAARILMLAAEEDWNDGTYPQQEHDYIQAQISLGKRKQSTYAFVKYNDRPPPQYPTAGKIRLHFKNGAKLDDTEVREFRTWLYSDLQSGLKNLPHLDERALNRPDGKCLLLNWLFCFDDAFWEATQDVPAMDPLGCKNDVLGKVKILKALHSVHAQPGPLLAQLIGVLIEAQPSLARMRNGRQIPDAKELRESLAIKLGIGKERTGRLNAVRTLAQNGLIPVLQFLAQRMDEVDSLESQARGFVGDLLLRLEWIANPASKAVMLPRLPPNWFWGMSYCRDAIEGAASGVFLNPDDMVRWQADQVGEPARILADTQELHVRILYLATAIVVLFSLLRIHEAPSSEPKDDADLLLGVLSFIRECTHNIDPAGLIDPVVKASNDMIVHYVEAAEKVA